MQLLRSLTVWFLILLGAIANGGLREAVLLPRLGTLPAFVLASIGWLRIHRASSALKTGAFWLLLTLGFEFGFGHFIQGKSWPVLLEAYTFQNGNIWPLVLVVTLFAPLIAWRIRGGSPS